MGQSYPQSTERDARGKEVLGGDDIARSLTRIAYEIIERNKGARGLVIAGIPTRGEYLARRLIERIKEVSGEQADLAIIDTTMFRDDLHRHPIRTPHLSSIPAGGIDARVVVLVDDVLYTGRTIKAALDALGSLGRADSVQLAILVDRGHRELPIRPDFVGKNLPTSREETVKILLTEADGKDAVILGGHN